MKKKSPQIRSVRNARTPLGEDREGASRRSRRQSTAALLAAVMVAGAGALAPKAQAAALTWTGAVDGNWDTTTANWSAPGTFTDGGVDGLTFTDAGANKTVSLAAGMTPSSVTVNNSVGNDYIFQTNGFDGTGGLTKDGTGTLTLSAANAYTGGTILNGGIVTLGTSGTLGDATGTIAVGAGNSATLNLLGTANRTITSGTITLNAGSQLTITHSEFVAATQASTTFSGALSGAGTLVLGTVTGTPEGTPHRRTGFTGGFSTFTGDIIVESGSNFLPGATMVNSNNLTVNSGGYITLSGGATATFGSLTGGGNITKDGGGGLATLSVASGNFSGVISHTPLAGGGSIALTKTGAGTLTLTNANTYTGTTTITGGTLALSGGNNRLLSTGTVNFGGSGTLDLGSTNQTLATLSFSPGTFTGAVTGSGILAATNINIFGSSGASSSATMDFGSLGMPLTVNATNMVVASQGTGAVGGNQIGNANFLGDTGGTIGTLIVGRSTRNNGANDAGNATGSFTMGSGDLTATTMILGQDTAGGTYTINSTAAGTFTTGSGTVQVTTLTLGDKRSASNTIGVSGTFNLDNGGTLEATTIANGGTANTAATRTFNWNDGTITNLGVTNLTISSATSDATGLKIRLASTGTHTFDIVSGQTGTVSAQLIDLTSGGTLNKAGAGTLTFSGAAANTYTGLTTVSAGTLEITADGALGTTASGTTVNSGGTLKLTGVTYATTEALALNGTGAGGAGALQNSGTSTYAGAITIVTDATIHNGGVGDELTLTGGINKTGTTVTFSGAGTTHISGTGLFGVGGAPNSDVVIDGVGQGTTVNLNADSFFDGHVTVTNTSNLFVNANLNTVDDVGGGAGTGGTGTVTVDGTSRLGGSGSITTASLTVAGQITGGDFGAIDTLLITAANVNLNGTYLADINLTNATGYAADGTAGDLITINGDLDLTGGLVFDLQGTNTPPPAGSHYAIKLLEFSGTGTLPDNYTVTGLDLASGQSVVRWGNAYYLVPEPASFALLGLGCLLLLRRPTRRRGRTAGAAPVGEQ